MKITKTLFTVLLVTALILSLSIAALAANPSATAEQMAAELKAWDLFRGVSDTNFDLYRAPTRAEALVMLIRSEGKESEALAGGCEHPFTDVPDWADSYVGYAYENGLTDGISATLFGAANAAGANIYLTFMLRALGYDDKACDFSWESPFALAESIGLIDSAAADGTAMVNLNTFWRRDAVIVSRFALDCETKDGSTTLGELLGIDSNVHPVAAINPEYQTLADYFNVDLYYVTLMADSINNALAENGHPESYALTGVEARIQSGELGAYLESAETAEDCFLNFVEDETEGAFGELPA